MNVRYTGPPDTVNRDVAAALADRAEPSEVQLEAHDGRTVAATDTGGAPVELVPGQVYDLPAELARRLVRSSAHWARVQNYDDLPHDELRRMAAGRGVEGRSGMTKPELVAALRGADDADAGTAAGGRTEAVGGQEGAEAGGTSPDAAGAPEGLQGAEAPGGEQA